MSVLSVIGGLLGGPRPARGHGRVLFSGSDAIPAGSARKSTPPLQPEAAPERWGGYRPAYRSTRWVKGLTPDRIARLLAQAEQGYPGEMARLLHEVERRDPHMMAELGKRKRAAAMLEWHIEPASDRARDRRVADDIERRIGQIRRFHQGLIDLLDAISKGYAVVESEWVVDDDGAWIRRFEWRPQWYFVPDADDPAKPWRVVDKSDSLRGKAMSPARFIVHQAHSMSGWAAEAGIGQALVWFYLFKRYALTDWNSYGELFGAPLRVGHFPAGSKPDDIDRLEEALDQLGVDAWAAIPDDMKVEFVTPAGGKVGPEVYERMVRLCDRVISIGVLGQTLTTSEGERGSLAQARVHQDVRFDLTASDGLELADTLTEQLVEPLVRFNHGDVPLPKFEFHVDPPSDDKLEGEVRESRGRQFGQALTLGLPVAASQVREDLDIREPSAGEDVLVLANIRETPSTAGTSLVGPGGVGLGERGGVLPTPCGVRSTSRGHPLTGVAESGGRYMGEGSGRQGDAESSPRLSRFADGDVPPWLAQAEQAARRWRARGGDAAWRELARSIQDGLVGARSLDEVNTRFVQIIDRLDLADAAEALAEGTLTADLVGRLHVELSDQVASDLPQLAPTEAIDFWVKNEKIVTPDEFAALVAEHRSRAFTISGWHSLDALAEAKELLDTMVRTGGTVGEFEDALQAAGHAMSPRHLDVVFNNAEAQANAVGRFRQQTRPQTIARRPFWRYIAMDDERVRREHQAMHGRVYRADDPIWQVWYPPNGHQCRCRVSAHTEAEISANGWTVYTRLPSDTASVGPLLPDKGFRRNPAVEPHRFDFSGFPASWRQALDLEAA